MVCLTHRVCIRACTRHSSYALIVIRRDGQFNLEPNRPGRPRLTETFACCAWISNDVWVRITQSRKLLKAGPAFNNPPNLSAGFASTINRVNKERLYSKSESDAPSPAPISSSLTMISRIKPRYQIWDLWRSELHRIARNPGWGLTR